MEIHVLIIIASAIIFFFIGYISARAKLVSATGIAASIIEGIIDPAVLVRSVARIKTLGIITSLIPLMVTACQKSLSNSIFLAMNNPMAISTTGDALPAIISMVRSMLCGSVIPNAKHIDPRAMAMSRGLVIIFLMTWRMLTVFDL